MEKSVFQPVTPYKVETMNENAKMKSETLKAPMQAVVHQLNVAVGDVVAANAELVVLEAMKMHHGLATVSGGRVVEDRRSARFGGARFAPTPSSFPVPIPRWGHPPLDDQMAHGTARVGEQVGPEESASEQQRADRCPAKVVERPQVQQLRELHGDGECVAGEGDAEGRPTRSEHPQATTRRHRPGRISAPWADDRPCLQGWLPRGQAEHGGRDHHDRTGEASSSVVHGRIIVR